jgi:hypothetical protein
MIGIIGYQKTGKAVSTNFSSKSNDFGGQVVVHTYNTSTTETKAGG